MDAIEKYEEARYFVIFCVCLCCVYTGRDTLTRLAGNRKDGEKTQRLQLWYTTATVRSHSMDFELNSNLSVLGNPFLIQTKGSPGHLLQVKKNRFKRRNKPESKLKIANGECCEMLQKML